MSDLSEFCKFVPDDASCVAEVAATTDETGGATGKQVVDDMDKEIDADM